MGVGVSSGPNASAKLSSAGMTTLSQWSDGWNWSGASYHDVARVPAMRIEAADTRRPAPARDHWPRIAHSIDYRERLADVRVPTLVWIGRYDPQAPIACSKELAAGIHGARLVMFEHSGHEPFVEESERFAALVAECLGGSGRNEQATSSHLKFCPHSQGP
jgi:pimeloyl-ACP methyl ester carboxylesterase